MVEKRPRSRARHTRRHPRRRSSAAVEHRNWAELPRDVLSVIFRKLRAIDVLWTARAVCRPWRQLALDPQIRCRIDMRYPSDLFNAIDMEKIARAAIDRSGGHVEEFFAQYFGSDDLLSYIADRTTGLRSLILIAPYTVTGEGLAEFAGRCPLLEEVQIIDYSYSEKPYSDVGLARPELKRFCLNTMWYKVPFSDSNPVINLDSDAIGIANMSQLRELQLIGNQMTNKGLHAILDKCLHLESIDIRACLNVNVDAVLLGKLVRIRTVKLPHDSTVGYEFHTGIEGDGDYPSGYSDPDD